MLTLKRLFKDWKQANKEKEYKELAKLNKELTEHYASITDLSEEEVLKLGERIFNNKKFREKIVDKLKKEVDNGLARRALLASGLGAMGIGSILSLLGSKADALKVKFYQDKMSFDDEFYLPVVLPFSAMVYIDGTRVEAVNWKGKLLAHGNSGVDDENIVKTALNSLTPNRTKRERVVLIGEFTLESKIQIPSFTEFDITEAKFIVKDTVGLELDGAAYSIIRGGKLEGQGTTTGQTGILIKNTSYSNHIYDIYIYNFQTGIELKKETSKPNSNYLINPKIGTTNCPLKINEVSGFTLMGGTINIYETPVSIGTEGTDYTTSVVIIGTYFETKNTTTIPAIKIGSKALRTIIINPLTTVFGSVEVVDLGVRSVIIGPSLIDTNDDGIAEIGGNRAYFGKNMWIDKDGYLHGAIEYASDIDIEFYTKTGVLAGILNQNWSQLKVRASDPDTTGWGTSEAGRLWFNTTDKAFKFWDGSRITYVGIRGVFPIVLGTQSIAAGATVLAARFTVPTGKTLKIHAIAELYDPDGYISAEVYNVTDATTVASVDGFDDTGWEIAEGKDVEFRVKNSDSGTAHDGNYGFLVSFV